MITEAMLREAADTAASTIRTTPPMELKGSTEYTRRLAELAEYDNGWMPGSPKPAELAITTAALILSEVDRQLTAAGEQFHRPGIFALTAGGIQLEWGQYEMEIGNDGTARIDHYCDSGNFDRTLCPEPCGEMHSYCTICGKRQDGCAHHPNGQLPEQPDDIDTDSRRLPTAGNAAERVRAYIQKAGDGLYDEFVGAPLYGRDLEALCRVEGHLRALLDQLRPTPDLYLGDSPIVDRLAAILDGDLS